MPLGAEVTEFLTHLEPREVLLDLFTLSCVRGSRVTEKLLTRATFLCGFSSFGLWKVVTIGAVEGYQVLA